MEKFKLPPINIVQKRLMVEYVQKYPNLAKQKFSAAFTFKKAQKHWEDLAQILNSVPGGSKKTWMQWRKTWTDIKKNAKNKAATNQLYMQGTGGGPAVPKEKEVTDLEKSILEMIGNVVQRGHENITETPIEFNFDKDGNENIIIEVMESGSEETETTDKPFPEMDLYTNPIPSTSKGVEKLEPIKKRLFETPTIRHTNDRKDELISPKIDHDSSIQSSSEPSHNNKKTAVKILSDSAKLNKTEKCMSSGKRLSVTRRLENSQKATSDMLRSIELRTSIVEQYYKKKVSTLSIWRGTMKKKLNSRNKTLKYGKEF